MRYGEELQQKEDNKHGSCKQYLNFPPQVSNFGVYAISDSLITFIIDLCFPFVVDHC